MLIRFYMVTGEKGWLPYGTDCSGEAKREAYCVKVNVTTLAFANIVLTFWQNWTCCRVAVWSSVAMGPHCTLQCLGAVSATRPTISSLREPLKRLVTNTHEEEN